MAVRFEPLEIPDVVLVEARRFPDTRGSFWESYKRSEFAANGISETFVQDNISHSVRGVLRGLHYQKQPAVQAKLVMVLSGEIFDVAVDIRKGSPTYGRWVGTVLSARDLRMLYIPEGFAHGFCVTSDAANVLYKVTSEYAPECERGVVWNDPELNIQWPVNDPLLSDKDACLPFLKDSDNDFVCVDERDRAPSRR